MKAPVKYNAAGHAIMHMLPMLAEGMGPGGTYLSFNRKDENEPNANAIEVMVREKVYENGQDDDRLVAKRLVVINRTFPNTHRVFSVSFVDFTDSNNRVVFALHFQAPQILDVAAMLVQYLFLGLTEEQVREKVPPFDLQAFLKEMQYQRGEAKQVAVAALEEAPPIPPGEPG